MKLFACAVCGAGLFFDDARCGACGAGAGYAPGPEAMLAVGEDGVAQGGGWRRCGNAAPGLEACNWLVAADDPNPLCLSCRLNRTIPDLSVDDHAALWRAIEAEKRRLVYAALRLGLPIAPRSEDPAGLAFDFLADEDPAFSKRGKVMTGHAEGLITLNVREADPAERERMRQEMDEPYRTVLGHLRHEAGHYYWERLVRDGPWLDRFRAVFGDEREDYAAALERHYADGPPADWRARCVSAYAASHPWEDWAESFAHYLHMADTLETAWAFGLRAAPRGEAGAALAARADFDPYAADDFATLSAAWLPLTVALNCLSRSMGQGHLYPFALTDPALEKLALVHDVLRDGGRGGPVAAPDPAAPDPAPSGPAPSGPAPSGPASPGPALAGP